MARISRDRLRQLFYELVEDMDSDDVIEMLIKEMTVTNFELIVAELLNKHIINKDEEL